MKAKLKIFKIGAALKRMAKINEEIRYKTCFEEETFSTGIIAFRPGTDKDPKQISHDDKDVVCHVLKGSGRLRINGRKTPLRPGTICHIPKGTPHDFAAAKTGELVLFYTLIKTAQEDPLNSRIWVRSSHRRRPITKSPARG